MSAYLMPMKLHEIPIETGLRVMYVLSLIILHANLWGIIVYLMMDPS
jgi:hypothetical protein